MTIGSQSFGFSSLRPALLGAMLLAIAAAPPAGAVHVRATVNSHVTGINAIGGTIIGVGPGAPSVDSSGTDVAALGGLNPYDQSSFMANGCTTGTSLCNDVRILIGGYIDIDTTPGFAVVAPRIESQDVATFIFSAAGTLELNLDTDVLWGENPLSGLPGAGISRYSFGEWQLIGPGGFAFGPSRNDATGDFALAQVLSFDLAPGTYQLLSPAVSIFLCAEAPADGFCGATQVPAPASPALLAAGLLGLLALRAGRRAILLVAGITAGTLAVEPAKAALFNFRIEFVSGPLAGEGFNGSFQTASDPPNIWTQDGFKRPTIFDPVDPSSILLTFDITVAGKAFDRNDDDQTYVRIEMLDDPSTRIDYFGKRGDGTSLSIWKQMLKGQQINYVHFRDTAAGEDSYGDLVSLEQGIDSIAIDPGRPEDETLLSFLGLSSERELRLLTPSDDLRAVPSPGVGLLLATSLMGFAVARRIGTTRRAKCSPASFDSVPAWSSPMSRE